MPLPTEIHRYCAVRGPHVDKGSREHFEMRIHNGAVEGMNNKAKVVSRRCYGFRTATHYITALYHCLGNLPEPQLVHKFL